MRKLASIVLLSSVTYLEREGLVFKEIGTESLVSFKVVSNRYLLKMK